MSTAERKEFKKIIRGYLESGRLGDEAFADMSLLYASLTDPSLEGDSFKHLQKYEQVGAGWVEIHAQVRA